MEEQLVVDNTSQQSKETISEETNDFSKWFESLDERSRSLIETYTAGLKKALESERGNRKKLLDELRSKGERESELEKSLQDLSNRLEEANRRVVFFESSPEDLMNPRLAWVLATAENLFTKKGDPDWDAIREKAPEIFSRSRKVPSINAGSGLSSEVSPAQNMNTFIRAAAGRRP